MTFAPLSACQVYEHVWELAEPVTVCGRGAEGYCRRLVSAEVMLERLSARFYQESLVDLGVAVEDESGQVLMAPPLAEAGSLLFAVHDSSNALVDLVSEHGAASGRAPAMAMLEDASLRWALADCEGVLFVTSRPEDCAWFRMAQLPAVLCPMLEELTVNLVYNLYRRVRAVVKRRLRPGTESTDEDGWSLAGEPRPAPLLVLVAWMPTLGGHAEPTELVDQATNLARALRLLSLTPPEVCLWSPGQAEIDASSLLWTCGDYHRLREVILASVAQQGKSLASLLAVPELPYLEARARYRSAQAVAVDSDHEDEELAEIRRAYQCAVERDLIAPLLSQGNRSRDPVKRALYAALAETASEFFCSAPAASQCESDARRPIEPLRRLATPLRAMTALAHLLKKL